MAGKKKPLKLLITVTSPEIYARAQAEPNTSALGEALFAKHYGMAIQGDSMQAQLRRMELDKMLAPGPAANTAGGLISPPAPPADEISDEDGDLDGQFETPAAETPNSSTAETGVVNATETPEPDILPDRPGTAEKAPAPAFAPVATMAPPQTEFAPGTKLCPNCGQPMGSSPYCLNCV